MSLTAAAIRALASKGLSASDIADIAEANEPVRSANATRQQRYRDNNKRNVTRNVTRPPIEEDHTPCDISPNGERQDSAGDVCAAVAEAWNAMAAANGLSSIAKLSDKRRRALHARISDDGLPAVLNAIERIPKSSFLRGETGNWSGATFQFLIRPDTVTKILEGTYDDRSKSKPASNDESQNPYVRAVLARQSARAGDGERSAGSWP